MCSVLVYGLSWCLCYYYYYYTYYTILILSFPSSSPLPLFLPIPPLLIYHSLIFSSILPLFSSSLPFFSSPFILYLSVLTYGYLCSSTFSSFPIYSLPSQSIFPSQYPFYTCRGVGYTYLYSSSFPDNLTPHVLSEWMVEVCRFEVCCVLF